MNNFASPLADAVKLAQALENQNNKTIREIFKAKINVSFLIKIKCEVLRKISTNLPHYYSMQFDNSTIITGTDETPEYDICRTIVGVHRHHSIFLSEQEIREMQRSKKYQQQLVDEVIEKIELRQAGSAFFRRKQLLLGDEFLYFPVPYELFVMCMRSIYMISDNTSPLFFEYHNILGNALSSLTLMENNLLSSAYPLCRGMIEQHLKVLILERHPAHYQDFEKFRMFEIEQSCCSQKYPDEFINLYNNRQIPYYESKVNYLHYGWLDGIKDYANQKSNRYSIYGILEYLMQSADDKQRQALIRIEALYKMCHGYTHGSAHFVKYPLLHYFEISLMLFHIVTSVFTSIHDILKADLLPQDKLLFDILNRDFAVLSRQYSMRTGSLFDSYYNIHK